VEDLRALLAAVVAATPSVRAVTSGAILSDYQVCDVVRRA
jgi:diphthamide synthase (EF-2-diphthine--ammonia ligase)